MLSLLYGRAARFRRAWYDRHPDRRRQLRHPVVSVGNLVVGGSGKTPLVATLARFLLERGERPAILSRGYRRRSSADGVVVVSDGQRVLETTERSGDEPQMLARALPGVPVLVCAQRHLAGLVAEERLGCTVHLLDDGFQHMQLARDVDLLVVSRPDLDERVLPAGRLREGLAAAQSADAVLVPGTEADVRAVEDALGCARIYRLIARYEPLRPVGPAGSVVVRPGASIVAMAGIARPERFFGALRAEGWEVVRELAFGDHRWFTDADLREVAAAARNAGAEAIVTTEKDAVRLDAGRLRALAGLPLASLPLTVAVEPSAGFGDWLTERLRAARARRGLAA